MNDLPTISELAEEYGATFKTIHDVVIWKDLKKLGQKRIRYYQSMLFLIDTNDDARLAIEFVIAELRHIFGIYKTDLICGTCKFPITALMKYLKHKDGRIMCIGCFEKQTGKKIE